MAERKHITLIYQYSENWIGGTYYILNIIKALNFLEDALKPHLTIVHKKESPVDVIQEIKYPYLDYAVYETGSLNIVKRAINKLFANKFGEKIFKRKLPGVNLYPVNPDIDTRNAKNFYFWITDFQNRHLTQFFEKDELERRKGFQDYINRYNKPVAFSSESAKSDFDTFYPHNKCKKIVLPFASILNNDFEKIPMESLAIKFGINKPFFIVPNQFWQHKNHWVILKAAKILKDSNVSFQVVLTGKEYDHRNPDYVTTLKSFVKENGLEKDVLFLGFIDRNEQLQLIKNALSVIQPSLFEGWSTVVEDAKALNQFIMVSDIALHREQVKENCIFFNPENAEYLATIMAEAINKPPLLVNIDYKKNIYNFALKVVSAF